MHVEAETTMITCETRDDAVIATLDAPPLNILSAAMMSRLAEAIDDAQRRPSAKALVLRAGAACRAFSAGADVAEHRPDQAPAMIAAFSRLFDVLGACPLPIIAVVDGAALGAGFELVTVADIVLASERATFGQPEIRLGFFAPVGVAWLARRVGVGRAMEITSTGRTYTAAEMHTAGLVSRVVPREEIDAAQDAVLDDMRRASAAVLRMNVRLVRQLHDQPFAAARREAERVFLTELLATDDVREGLAAFFDKRPPAWMNR